MMNGFPLFRFFTLVILLPGAMYTVGCGPAGTYNAETRAIARGDAAAWRRLVEPSSVPEIQQYYQDMEDWMTGLTDLRRVAVKKFGRKEASKIVGDLGGVPYPQEVAMRRRRISLDEDNRKDAAKRTDGVVMYRGTQYRKANGRWLVYAPTAQELIDSDVDFANTGVMGMAGREAKELAARIRAGESKTVQDVKDARRWKQAGHSESISRPMHTCGASTQPIVPDRSSPEATMDTMVRAFEAGDTKAMAECFTFHNSMDADYLNSYHAELASRMTFQSVAVKRFGLKEGKQLVAGIFHGTLSPTITNPGLGEVRIEGDDAFTSRSMAQRGLPVPMPDMKKIDGQWRFIYARAGPVQSSEKAVEAEKRRTARQLHWAKQIDCGEFADAWSAFKQFRAEQMMEKPSRSPTD